MILKFLHDIDIYGATYKKGDTMTVDKYCDKIDKDRVVVSFGYGKYVLWTIGKDVELGENLDICPSCGRRKENAVRS